MEQIRPRHIAETQNEELLEMQTEETEASPFREAVEQISVYDLATETEPDQIRVREYLQSFNEEMLFDIFHEYFRRSGSENRSINWIRFDKVRILHKTAEEENISASPYGTSSANEGIELYSHLLKDRSDVLWTLIHEECHSISQQNWEHFRLLDDQNTVVGRTSEGTTGLTHTKIGSGKLKQPVKKTNMQINEGVTELLTERIFREYLQRSGENIFGDRPENAPKKWKELQIEEAVADQKFTAYERYWKNTKFYIDLVSQIAEIPKETIEESVIRAYTRNGTLILDDAILDSLGEKHPNLPSILLTIINSEKGEGSIAQLIECMTEDRNVPAELQAQISQAIQQVKAEWGDAYTKSSNSV